jgi:hypothetical protein
MCVAHRGYSYTVGSAKAATWRNGLKTPKSHLTKLFELDPTASKRVCLDLRLA